MNELIRIKCPWCSAILSVAYQSGIENKYVTCPVCKKQSPFRQCHNVQTNEDDGGCTQFRLPESAPMNEKVGVVKIVPSGISYQLKLGKNIIGRKASASKANFQIDTGENKRLSREHIVIDVKRESDRGYVHYLSLFKERVNDTFVDDNQLLYGDCIILKTGDIIKLPDVKLLFEILDEEATIIQNPEQ